MKFEISKPKFKVGDVVVVKSYDMVIGTIFERRIELRYDPDNDQAPKESGWMYGVMKNAREGHTISENLIFSLSEIQDSVKNIGLEETSEKYKIYINKLAYALQTIYV